MRKQYEYFINNEKISKKEFFEELKKHCNKVRRVCTIAEWCGVDIMEFDEEAYKRNMRDIQRGYGVILFNGIGAGKTFSRREVR